MDAHAVIDSLHRGKVLAAAVPATKPSRLAWVGVYPLNPSDPFTVKFLRNEGVSVSPAMRGPIFHIRAFEVYRKLLERDACIAEREMMNKRSHFAFGDSELEAKLKDLGLRIDQLDLPFKSDYPI